MSGRAKTASPRRTRSKSAKKIARPKSKSPTPNRTTKKATPKKATPKKATPKKATPRSRSRSKSVSKKASPKKASPKKASPKKASPKKASPKKKKASPKKQEPESESESEAEAESEAEPEDEDEPELVAAPSGVYDKLKVFAQSIWFPFMVGAMSGINLFTLVLSAPTALLYVTGVLAKPSRVVFNAFVNAVGTMIGVLAMVYLIDQSGTKVDQYFEAQFPVLQNSTKWAGVKDSIDKNKEWGLVGVGMVSAMPIILHPIIMFCMIGEAESGRVAWLTAMFIGRVFKYTVMGMLATSAPKALKFFGVDITKLGLKKD